MRKAFPIKELPDQSVLKKLLRLEKSTGRLFWKKRSDEWFTTNGYFPLSSVRQRWNSAHAGKEAFTAISGRPESGKYRVGTLLRKRYMAHRIVYKMVHGSDPDHIDHVNGDRLDNRPCNLRSTNTEGNSRNRRRQKSNRSGFTGVLWRPNVQKWHAQITVRSKYRHLGYYDTIEEAARARIAGEKKYGFHPNHGRRV